MKLVVFIGFLAAARLLAQDSGTVMGRVTDSATGFGNPGVAVELRQNDVFYQTTTDESGAFRLVGVKYNDYGGSTVEKSGYDRHGDVPSILSGVVRVHGQDPVRWDIQMDPWNTLHGHVLDADGKPAAKVQVQLKRLAALGGLNADTTSDGNGAFLFEKVKPGSYTLLAKPTQRDQIQEGVRLEAVPTYFPSTVEISQAETIVIRGGVDLADDEIRLRTSPVYHVRGMVLNTAGKPAPNATVKLMRPGGQGTQQYGLGIVGASMSMIAGPALPNQEVEVESGEDGKFEFPSVQPGDWRVEAIQKDLPVSSGGASAIVSARDIEDLEIRLASPFNWEVVSDWGDAKSPQNNSRLPAVLMALDGQPRPDYPDGEPRHFAHVAPGRYRVVPPLPLPGFYVVSMLVGGREVLGQEVDLTPGSPPLRIVYKTSASSLRGTVENGEGSTVVLLSQESPQAARGLSSMRTVKCGPGGAFDMGGVPPGDYYAVAFDRFEPMQAVGPAETIRSNAVLARVEEGAAASVELHVTHWPQ